MREGVEGEKKEKEREREREEMRLMERKKREISRHAQVLQHSLGSRCLVSKGKGRK